MLPKFIGRLRDQTGNYHLGFRVLIGTALLGAVAVAWLRRKRSDNDAGTR